MDLESDLAKELFDKVITPIQDKNKDKQIEIQKERRTNTLDQLNLKHKELQDKAINDAQIWSTMVSSPSESNMKDDIQPSEQIESPMVPSPSESNMNDTQPSEQTSMGNELPQAPTSNETSIMPPKPPISQNRCKAKDHNIDISKDCTKEGNLTKKAKLILHPDKNPSCIKDADAKFKELQNLCNPKEDINGALILDNSFNENGDNYCWLNAPLYAYVAFSDIVGLYTFNCNEINPTKDSMVIIPGFTDNRKYNINAAMYVGKSENPDSHPNSDIIRLYINGSNDDAKKFINDTTWIEYNDNNDGANITVKINPENFKVKPRTTSDEDAIYKNIYDLMLKSRLPSTIWNNELYKEIHTELCKLHTCNDNSEIRAINNRDYSNAYPVLDIFNNVLVKKCPESQSPITFKEHTITPSNVQSGYNKLIKDIDGKRLIAFVKGENLISNTELNVGHYVTYIRNKDKKYPDKWKKYDSGITTKDYDDVPSEIFPQSNEESKVWYVYGIYKEPEEYEFDTEQVEQETTTSSSPVTTTAPEPAPEPALVPEPEVVEPEVVVEPEPALKQATLEEKLIKILSSVLKSETATKASAVPVSAPSVKQATLEEKLIKILRNSLSSSAPATLSSSAPATLSSSLPATLSSSEPATLSSSAPATLSSSIPETLKTT